LGKIGFEQRQAEYTATIYPGRRTTSPSTRQRFSGLTAWAPRWGISPRPSTVRSRAGRTHGCNGSRPACSTASAAGVTGIFVSAVASSLEWY